MRKSTVILWLCILVLITCLSNCEGHLAVTVDSCGTAEQCQELERLKAMPEFQNARSPATMQP